MKTIVVIRLNPIVDSWYKKEAIDKQMTKSELMRKILTEHKERGIYDQKINH